LTRIRKEGQYKEDRTGVGCYSIWGASLRHDFKDGFPLITTKRMWFRGIVTELLWMLSGSKNTAFLEEHGVGHIWTPWADSDGNLGKIYGPSWRNWDDSGLDQLKSVIEQIKDDPYSRRHLVLAWNPEAVWSGDAKLPPCHFAFQFQVQGRKLNMNWVMRSSDCVLGLPWNLAFYALLQSMVAQICNLEPGILTYWGNDVHVYSNHLEGVDLQIGRYLQGLGTYDFPKLIINPDIIDIDDFTFDDIKLEGYECHPAIPQPLAV
jgi:thymidylate synthase